MFFRENEAKTVIKVCKKCNKKFKLFITEQRLDLMGEAEKIICPYCGEINGVSKSFEYTSVLIEDEV